MGGGGDHPSPFDVTASGQLANRCLDHVLGQNIL